MKILIIRFSSIGDIVLTTPVLRCLKEQLPEVEIHFLTKGKFKSLLVNNPHIDQLLTIEKSVDEIVDRLKSENYDRIIDLHNNLRTLALKRKLRKPSHSFRKLNVEKWLLVNFKVNRMPAVHIVDRYLQTVKSLGVVSDGKPCEFYIDKENEVDVQGQYQISSRSYISVAIGAQFATKTLPSSQLIEILKGFDYPIVLLGGSDDQEKGSEIQKGLGSQKVLNLCGSLNLQQSASLVQQSAVILTHDTGLMHIASCFQVPIVSVWGNTVPDLGMYPYYPNQPELFSIHEVDNLACRPCSKIGFQSCPKKHFRCMMNQDLAEIKSTLQKFLPTKNQ